MAKKPAYEVVGELIAFIFCRQAVVSVVAEARIMQYAYPAPDRIGLRG